MPSTAASAPRAATRPFRSFGWSLAGAVGLSLSFPPTGLYPLAWVSLVPLLVRWSEHKTWQECAREVYALVLALTACTGFWLLFDRDAGRAVAGGAGLLLVPLPLVAAFTLSGIVRRRFGLVVGLAALVLTTLALEYGLLAGSVDAPWLLLGHTQAEALPFIQTADLGGVLLISFWVLMLNVAAFAAAPRLVGKGAWTRSVGESGVAVAFFAVLVALPAVYGGVQTTWAEAPAGYTRLGIIQPGVPSRLWDDDPGAGRVDLLAHLSDRLLGRWTAADSAQATGTLRLVSDVLDLRARRADAETLGLLIWPQGALPYMGSPEREAETLGRLGQWCAQRNVALITGATTRVADGDATSALRIGADGHALRYDQMRRVPVADAPVTLGHTRTLFPIGGARVATLLGFESLFGDHARRFAADGADLFVVLAQSDRWGRSSGLYQHLQATRLRAIETRRAIVVASVGGVSAVVQPSGQIDEATAWMEQGLVPLDVPTFRAETVYTRHGDWVGRLALAGALMLYLAAGAVFWVRPEAPKRPTWRA